MNYKTKQELIEFLKPFVLENRFELFNRILSERTRFITVVLEDIYQPQNASAVLRTCDCFGIQDVHIIENKNVFELNKDVVLGSAQWLTLYNYNKKEDNSAHAIENLKKKGYKIVATSPHADDNLLSDFNIQSGKTAFVFGTEKSGISETVKEMADEFVKVPMFGFTESFNISVSAALILHSTTEKLRNSKTHYGLTENEKADLLLQWLRNTIKKVSLLEKKFKELNDKSFDLNHLKL